MDRPEKRLRVVSDPFRDRMQPPRHPELRAQRAALIAAIGDVRLAHRSHCLDRRFFWGHVVLVAICTFALYLPWGDDLWITALAVPWFYLPVTALWYEVGRRVLIRDLKTNYPAFKRACEFAQELQHPSDRFSFDRLLDTFQSDYDEAYERAKPWWRRPGTDA